MPTTPKHMLADIDELLHRQVNPSPSFIRDGRPSSAAFKPTPKDGGELSVSRGLKIDAKGAHAAFIAKGFKSAGTWSITVGEVGAAGLHAYEDELPDDPAHAVIDFKPLQTNGAIQSAADRLKRAAIERGATYLPSAGVTVPSTPPTLPMTGQINDTGQALKKPLSSESISFVASVNPKHGPDSSGTL